ncbi:MAG: hypothetical protein JWP80_970 [Pseudomonas sp.]|nr:hypothetical protein [Pseudomonas sp.]
MHRREEFLRRAVEAHRAYAEAADTLRRLMKENHPAGPEWVEAIERKKQALVVWSTLPLKYGEFDEGN